MRARMFSWAVFAALLLNIVLLINTASGCRDNLLPPKHSALFVFGDSLFDSGNNNYFDTLLRFKANFSPYGKTFFGYPTGRATDGRIIPDFIRLPLIPPYLQPGQKWEYGVNFASIGGGVLDDTHPGYVINLRDQLRNFMNVEQHLREKLGDEEAKALLSSAVYLFNIGSNDYFAPFQENSRFFRSQHVQKEYIGRLIGNLTNAIQEIYNKGGRKFAFLGLSPIGCLPWVRAFDPPRTNGCAQELVEIAKQHNIALSQLLQKLENHLKDFKHSTHDFFTSFSDRSNNPRKYGFTAGKMACCGSGIYRGLPTCGKVMNGYDLCENPREFLFFDSGHATEKANEQFAKLLWSGDSDVTWPYNLKSLFEIDNKCRSNVSTE
ncbi:GDSL esterase/lipase 1 isoform X2 [Morus notabilis]|uniref:GDSL esterase/lipase 1 isoform X2 n=1 Tax=Morus notabilis TaxID=981085 RepID=UPI000CED43E6|nr:GDSL esterase/lipase 1 isoform X2 [Morus notabilis]